MYASSWVPSATGLHGTGRYLVNRPSDSLAPHALEGVLRTARKLPRRHVPQRVGPRVPERAVVGEDLHVVVALPAGGLERAEQRRQADDPAWTKWGEPVYGRADCLDALPRVARPLHQGQREDRRDHRNGAGRTEPRRGKSVERRTVIRELQLPDADRISAGGLVRGDVVRERRRQRRDLRDRKRRPDAGSLGRSSSRATRVPEPPPSPGPGQVLAPMWKRFRTGVRCPGCCVNGRQRKFWSSASEPEYGSPRSRLILAACRSAGESTTR